MLYLLLGSCGKCGGGGAATRVVVRTVFTFPDIPPGFAAPANALCPAGHRAVGGGCMTSSAHLTPVDIGMITGSNAGYLCSYRNNDLVPLSYQVVVRAVCEPGPAP